MTRLSRSHPRYRSLVVRAALAEASQTGLVVPEGLIAHGRGEAFDYYLGERTIPSARRAERVAAAWLVAARRPVVSVNGNVAALASDGVARLARAVPHLRVEVNLFHRSPGRAEAVARRLRAAGVAEPLGVRPTARLPGLSSDRARIDAEGIAVADVCLVPLEDGDRATALSAAGIRVISLDLNPMSRTSVAADLPIVDELTRALREIAQAVTRTGAVAQSGRFSPFDARAALDDARRAMARRLRDPSGGAVSRRAARSSPRPPRGTARRMSRTR